MSLTPIAVLLLTTLLVTSTASMAAEDQSEATSVSIDLRQQGSPFQGWGTSLAWWAHGAGDWPEPRLDEIVRLVTDPHDGLGLTVFRYNIGGGDHPDHNHMRRWGDVPGFKNAAESPYDWNADAGQRRVLLKLIAASKQHNVTPIVEAFSNSPPWWMTVSGCAAGADDGGPNLKPEFESQFADYLADVAKFYRDRHNLEFHTLTPFNEPSANWWKAGKQQEGCHIPREQQARLIRLTREALDQRGLRTTLISATDDNNIDDCLANLLAYDAPTLKSLGQINTHSYYGSKRVDLRDAANRLAKPLWQSESGPLNVEGSEYEKIMVTARRIVVDINRLRPEVWCTWQIIGRGAWGCLHENRDRNGVEIAKMFHVLAAFTRHIRPGDRFVLLDSDRVLAAVSPATGRVSILLVNPDDAPHTFSLTLAGAEVTDSASGIRTTIDENLVEIPAVELRNGVLQTTAPPQSITCLTILKK